MIGKLKDFFKVKRNIAIVVIIFLVLVFFIKGFSAHRSEPSGEDVEAVEGETSDDMDDYEEEEESDIDLSEDAYLLESQESLRAQYGKLPEGYIWDMEGRMLSLGDKSMSAEDVIYAYLTGIRTLDLSMAQKYSRSSMVVSAYSDFFDKDSASESDYYDSFLRSMFKECLLSIKVEGISDSAVFAENKQVYTVNAEMLDLTDKDFWLKDKERIFDDLFIYSSDEGDSTKSEMYLYDYVLKHYQSKKAKTRKVTFDLTVEKYPDLDTGWLVSIDKDIYDACMYSDGTLMVNYIQEQFTEKGLPDKLDQLEEEALEEDIDEGEFINDGESEDGGSENPTSEDDFLSDEESHIGGNENPSMDEEE